ncbi:methyltransferase FkbM [Helicobacter aurati]|uniref:Methyltransferase FkbM n=1 Tax=Helicobacter aurati TaxID=137778 RepID=A0A3D8J670_9HELI|nr:methyltransferase FkbM [Helicobacter aurati]RDU72695.1 methyltransferase FkbM [Helicobacter aurati]
MKAASQTFYQCKSPVLFLTFNRLDTVEQTLPQILQAKPPKIYLASDGARENKKDSQGKLESEKVAKIRKYMLDTINQQCEIKTRFLDSNLGCKMGVSSAISWFFSQEEQGIILEDDCLPSLSFFRFCDELLEYYKETEQIFLISGWSGLDLLPRLKQYMQVDYFFSKYAHIWGWASWANRWTKYEREIEDFETHFAKMSFCNHREKRYWHKIFLSYIAGEIDTWDYPLTYSMWKHQAISIQPKHAFIKNIGFNREDATHTTSTSPIQALKNYDIDFPLQTPKTMQPTPKLEQAIFEGVFGGKQQYMLRLINKVSQKLLGKKLFWH